MTSSKYLCCQHLISSKVHSRSSDLIKMLLPSIIWPHQKPHAKHLTSSKASRQSFDLTKTPLLSNTWSKRTIQAHSLTCSSKHSSSLWDYEHTAKERELQAIHQPNHYVTPLPQQVVQSLPVLPSCVLLSLVSYWCFTHSQPVWLPQGHKNEKKFMSSKPL